MLGEGPIEKAAGMACGSWGWEERPHSPGIGQGVRHRAGNLHFDPVGDREGYAIRVGYPLRTGIDALQCLQGGAPL